MRCITTKFLGPTNLKGARVKASAYGGAFSTLPWNYELSVHDNHLAAATALAVLNDWIEPGTELQCGRLPDDTGYAVLVPA